jgi:hypothetical protein
MTSKTKAIKLINKINRDMGVQQVRLWRVKNVKSKNET